MSANTSDLHDKTLQAEMAWDYLTMAREDHAKNPTEESYNEVLACLDALAATMRTLKPAAPDAPEKFDSEPKNAHGLDSRKELESMKAPPIDEPAYDGCYHFTGSAFDLMAVAAALTYILLLAFVFVYSFNYPQPQNLARAQSSPNITDEPR